MTNFKKKDFSGQKNKLGLSFRKKKEFFGSKIGKKFENNVQKLTNFKEKKGLFRPKKQAEAELKKKKGFFRAKNWGGNQV